MWSIGTSVIRPGRWGTSGRSHREMRLAKVDRRIRSNGRPRSGQPMARLYVAGNLSDPTLHLNRPSGSWPTVDSRWGPGRLGRAARQACRKGRIRWTTNQTGSRLPSTRCPTGTTTRSWGYSFTGACTRFRGGPHRSPTSNRCSMTEARSRCCPTTLTPSGIGTRPRSRAARPGSTTVTPGAQTSTTTSSSPCSTKALRGPTWVPSPLCAERRVHATWCSPPSTTRASPSGRHRSRTRPRATIGPDGTWWAN